MGLDNKLSEAELDLIRHLAGSGASGSSIARTLNRTPSCVSTAMRRLGYPKKQHVALSLEVPAKTWVALSAAAARRHLKPDALALLIISGVVLRGSVHKAISFDARFAHEEGASLQV